MWSGFFEMGIFWVNVYIFFQKETDGLTRFPMSFLSSLSTKWLWGYGVARELGGLVMLRPTPAISWVSGLFLLWPRPASL